MLNLVILFDWLHLENTQMKAIKIGSGAKLDGPLDEFPKIYLMSFKTMIGDACAKK